jgi:hypothetical protein
MRSLPWLALALLLPPLLPRRAGGSPATAAQAYCVLRQDCSPGSAGCFPRATSAAERAPFPLSNASGIPPACPQYAAAGCCTPAANSQLFLSFILEESSLGEPASGGCPACSANVQDLWCAFACAPNQSDFVAVEGLRNVSGSPVALVVNVTLASDYAAATFGSCAGVGLVRSNPLLDSVTLFLAYMGQQGVSTANALVNFQLGGSSGGAGLALPVYNCCSFPANLSDPTATGNASCPCASCLGSCPGGSCNLSGAGGLGGGGGRLSLDIQAQYEYD